MRGVFENLNARHAEGASQQGSQGEWSVHLVSTTSWEVDCGGVASAHGMAELLTDVVVILSDGSLGGALHVFGLFEVNSFFPLQDEIEIGVGAEGPAAELEEVRDLKHRVLVTHS